MFNALIVSSGVFGFQWIDGSFVEDEIERPRWDGRNHPQDIDVVTFWRSPEQGIEGAHTQEEIFSYEKTFMDSHPEVFDQDGVKDRFSVDSYWVSLRQSPEALIERSAYWYGLWSHTKPADGQVWKGFIEVPISGSDIDAALDALGRIESDD